MATTTTSPWPDTSTSAVPDAPFSSMPLPSEDSHLPLDPNPTSPSPLLHVSFNQDHACFAVGTDSGFRVFSCDPFFQVFRRDFDRGRGVSLVEMLFRSNILAFVGGQYPPNKVMIWDDHPNRCIGELSFRSHVRSVRLRRDRVVVVLDLKIFVYNFDDLKLMHQIETFANPKGLCSLSHGAASMLLVCPGLLKGQVRLEHYSSKKTNFIMAHDSTIASFALTQDGLFLATASSKGTLLRVFNTADGTLLQELRRGADRADIYSLAFSSNAQWLAASSDKGTVHVFGLKINAGSQVKDTSRMAPDAVWSQSTSLSLLRGVLPKYFSSEWSVAQFRLVEGCQHIVGFGDEKNTVVILGMDGSFYKCQYDPVHGGEMYQLEYHNWLKPAETHDQIL
ncbi:hypothetical protein CARUB_v10023380mg [Capsella rubella]|uniref:Autophagy-related protein 18a n=1 Tax=Capsella rubella TaxID=81985 RepID=R0FX34_9BRAS|nr:autophagy-related protein 18a [Capsella rubella]EOA27261.1 hypothetical protein CARUB_v10023380mg [Capsella rubella]